MRFLSQKDNKPISLFGRLLNFGIAAQPLGITGFKKRQLFKIRVNPIVGYFTS
jgi:hypothetical protein